MVALISFSPPLTEAIGVSAVHLHRVGDFVYGNMPLISLAGDRLAICNDGTPAGYYLRKNPESTKWSIWFGGSEGGACHDAASCAKRSKV
jgi:hypothetical protein